MKRTKIKLLFSTIALVIAHTSGSVAGWYLKYGWYDIITHVIGGFWVGSIILWFVPKYFPKSALSRLISRNKALGVLVSIAVVAVLWETFELILVTLIKANYGVRLGLQPSVTDTLIDFVTGILGALLSVI